MPRTQDSAALRPGLTAVPPLPGIDFRMSYFTGENYIKLLCHIALISFLPGFDFRMSYSTGKNHI
jgi:hypothetical protein